MIRLSGTKLEKKKVKFNICYMFYNMVGVKLYTVTRMNYVLCK